MDLTYKIKTSRNNAEITLKEDFKSSMLEFEQYFFHFSISVLSDNKKVAVIKGIIFDNYLIEDDEESIANIADSIDGDVGGAMAMLYYDENYDESGEVCYIDRFYISPRFRQRGIGSYLLDNLQDILKYLLNANIAYFVTFINPRNSKGEDDNKMKKIMMNIFSKSDFEEIDNSGYYAKTCRS